MPINVYGENHWTLLVTYIQEKRIVYYDSMMSLGDESKFSTRYYLEGALRYFADEAKKRSLKFELTDWTLMSSMLSETPQQKGCIDCGVFAVMFADLITDDLPLTFSMADIPLFRQKICANILRKELKYSLPPPSLVIDEIASLSISDVQSSSSSTSGIAVSSFFTPNLSAHPPPSAVVEAASSCIGGACESVNGAESSLPKRAKVDESCKAPYGYITYLRETYTSEMPDPINVDKKDETFLTAALTSKKINFYDRESFAKLPKRKLSRK
jgi:hypothetical protein